MEFTARFKGLLRIVYLTDHAKIRIEERGLSFELVKQILEQGDVSAKPGRQDAFWIWMSLPDRKDNLICVSALIDHEALVVKTVLSNWRRF